MIRGSERARVYVKDFIKRVTEPAPPTIGTNPLEPKLIRQLLEDCEGSHGSPCNTVSTADNINIYLTNVDRYVSPRNQALNATLH